jgi:hypothetical protein
MSPHPRCSLDSAGSAHLTSPRAWSTTCGADIVTALRLLRRLACTAADVSGWSAAGVDSIWRALMTISAKGGDPHFPHDPPEGTSACCEHATSADVRKLSDTDLGRYISRSS